MEIPIGYFINVITDFAKGRTPYKHDTGSGGASHPVGTPPSPPRGNGDATPPAGPSDVPVATTTRELNAGPPSATATRELNAGPPTVTFERDDFSRNRTADRPIDFLGKLYDIPDSSTARTPEDRDRIKTREAQRMIIQYAAERAHGPGATTASPADIGDALRELYGETGKFANRRFGKNDGNVDADDINRLNQEMRDNVGLRAFHEMFLDFRRAQ